MEKEKDTGRKSTDATQSAADEFAHLRPKFESYTLQLYTLVQEFLRQDGIDVANIERRTKTLESFTEKIRRDGKKYSKPIEEVTDLSGLRVITYATDDIGRVDQCLRSSFAVHDESIDKGETLDPDRFGYRSLHLIISLTSDRLGLREFRDFAGLKAEVQIRTVLQHAWAAIDHRLRYKNEQAIPAEFRRRLFRISALLELADDEFSSVTERIRSVLTLREEFKTGELDPEISADSVDVFVHDEAENAELRLAAEKSGYYIAPDPPNTKNPLSSLLKTLSLAEINHISELQSLILTFTVHAEKSLKAVYQKWTLKARPKLIVIDLPTLFRLAVTLECGREHAAILHAVPYGPTLHRAIAEYLGISAEAAEQTQLSNVGPEQKDSDQIDAR